MIYFKKATRLRKLLLTIQTIKELKAGQIYARLILSGKRLIRRVLRKQADFLKINRNPVLLDLKIPLMNPEQAIIRANQALNNEFEFLNQKVKFEGQIDWKCPGASRLWRFNLHYSAIALDLIVAFELTGNLRYICYLKQYLRSWIDGNRFQTGDGWRPYTISLRVANWILAVSKGWSFLKEDREFCAELLGSIWGQLKFLRYNLEFDSRGNHLFENLKTLILGGVFFGFSGQGKAFFKIGQKYLARQISEQILPDGGHFERSPMYHSIILRGLLELTSVYHSHRLQPPIALGPVIERMTEFLEAMLLPDGQYVLFNDAVADEALVPEYLVSWAKSISGPISEKTQTTRFFKSSGYARLETKTGDILIFNCGNPGPPFLPAHAHADTLSFEWCMAEGTRLFIDPGVFEYAAGPWRDYFRSTKAHNTLQIDDRNSTEVWSSFRAARKAKVKFSGLEDTEEGIHAFAGHDGYTFLSGKPIHRRDIYLFKNNILLVLDTVTGAKEHLLESNLQVHPDWKVRLDDNQIISLFNKNYHLQLKFLKPGQISVQQGELNPISGWYSPRFSLKTPSFDIVWRSKVELPYQTGFICYPANFEVDCYLGNEEFLLNINGVQSSLKFKETVKKFII